MTLSLPHWLRPRRAAIAADGRFGYALVGLGHGAGKMVEALRDSPHAHVAAVVSSSLQRAERFAKHHGIAHAYTYDQWDLIAADAAIDAAYLPLPVGLHRRFAELAAAAGKHVLCEKPMAATVADAQAMIDACSAAKRLLMIAYRLDYDPMHDELKLMLAAGMLGTIEHVQSGFGFVAKPGWRFDPALAGGGSLYDVGVYPIHALHELFGKTLVTSAQIIEHPHTHMELDAAWMGTLGNGATFACSSSYTRRIPDTLSIRGERGTVTLTHAYAYERTQLRAEYRDAAGKLQALKLGDARRNASLFRLEAEHLAQCARNGVAMRSAGSKGRRDLESIAGIERIATRTTMASI
jgi:predicted dehydrogenase